MKKFINYISWAWLFGFCIIILSIIWRIMFFTFMPISYWIEYSSIKMLDLEQGEKIQIIHTIRNSRIETIWHYITTTSCNWSTSPFSLGSVVTECNTDTTSSWVVMWNPFDTVVFENKRQFSPLPKETAPKQVLRCFTPVLFGWGASVNKLELIFELMNLPNEYSASVESRVQYTLSASPRICTIFYWSIEG